MIPYIVCMCGREVGSLYKKFYEVRNADGDMEKLFADFGLTRSCCKKCLVTSTRFSDYYYKRHE